MRTKEDLVAEVRYLRSVLHRIANSKSDQFNEVEVWELRDIARESLRMSFKGQNYDPSIGRGTKI